MQSEDLRSGSTGCPSRAPGQDAGEHELSPRCAGCRLRQARMGAAQTLVFYRQQAFSGVHRCSSVVTRFFSDRGATNYGIVSRAYAPSEIICGLCVLLFHSLIHRKPK